MDIAVEVKDVDQAFRVGFWMKKTQILHKVNLVVPRQSVFGFLGANGAGKTTLIHLITGLRRPTSGEVQICGHDSTSILAKSKIGYLPERPYFHDHLTGEGLLRYFGALAGLKKTEITARIPKVLALVGMTKARHVELKRYSKGMLQRVGIAQALIHDPEVLVLDEPMSGLDPMGRKDIRELIVSLAGTGKTIFFSSHLIPDVEAICDQVGLISKGKLIGYGPISQFLETGPLHVEIGFGGLKIEKDDWPEFDSFREIADGARVVVTGQEAVDRVITRLLKQKAKILWVTPIRSSLESFFGVHSKGSSTKESKD